MDLQSQEQETGIRHIPKRVGFNVPTKGGGQSSTSAPDPTCLLSGSKQPKTLAENIGQREKEPAIKVGRKNKSIKGECQ